MATTHCRPSRDQLQTEPVIWSTWTLSDLRLCVTGFQCEIFIKVIYEHNIFLLLVKITVFYCTKLSVYSVWPKHYLKKMYGSYVVGARCLHDGGRFHFGAAIVFQEDASTALHIHTMLALNWIKKITTLM